MSGNLRIALIILSTILIVLLLTLIAKKKLPIKYSIFWAFASSIILIVGLFPKFVGTFPKIIGFETMSSLIIAIIVGLLLMITLLLTVIIAEQKRKITLLIQEVSILKEKMKD